MGKTKFCHGISDISDTYMGFIIDQWGVLHDGNKPYDGVVDCLKELKNRKKFIILLSNSSMRSEQTRQRLKQIGIGPSLYSTIVTSGDFICQGLKEGFGLFNGLGRRCYTFSRGADLSMLDGTGVEVVDDVNDADFLLIIGSESPVMSISDYEPVLRTAVKRGLKALCANPDSRALLGATYVMGAGLIARRYQDFGGVVHYIGKPHQPIYQYCMNLMKDKNVYPGQIVMVGDTMAHDIMGGWASGLDTCLVKSGLHSSSFRNARTPAETDNALNILIAQYSNVKPNYLVDRLLWGRALPDRKHKKHKKHVRRRGRTAKSPEESQDSQD